MESRVELFAAIRRDARLQDLSIRELAGHYRVHRRTVRQALASALPPPRKTPARTSRVLEPFQPAIEAMLRADLDAPKKQRHTARRILARLVDEHDRPEDEALVARLDDVDRLLRVEVELYEHELARSHRDR